MRGRMNYGSNVPRKKKPSTCFLASSLFFAVNSWQCRLFPVVGLSISLLTLFRLASTVFLSSRARWPGGKATGELCHRCIGDVTEGGRVSVGSCTREVILYQPYKSRVSAITHQWVVGLPTFVKS